MQRAKVVDGAPSKAAASVAAGAATVGMLTSGIKNKIVRSEAYARLKKAKKARTRVLNFPCS
jgi:Na+/glutamate symporter